MLRVVEQATRTDVGRQRRGNEDSLFARAPVFVVADGMGGAQAGEVASRIAVEAFEPGLPDGGGAEQRLATRIREANVRIYELASEDRARAGMGTTLAAALVGEDEVSIAHVGDSRAYLFRDGALERLTRDHSLVDELVRRGELTAEQAAEHPQKSIITKALGPEREVEPDTYTHAARAGDVFLLCSDGLTSMIDDDRVARVLRTTPDLRRAARELIDAANEAGGRDNITVILFRLGDVGATDGDGPETIEAPAVDRSAAGGVAVAPAPAPARPRAVVNRPDAAGSSPVRRRRRRGRQVAIGALTVVIVVGLIVGAGYLATREVYFVGTNPQGLVTVYRGLPYQLPFGIDFYERYYVSGVPASLVPAPRRQRLLDHQLRSHHDVVTLVDALEQGRLAR